MCANSLSSLLPPTPTPPHTLPTQAQQIRLTELKAELASERACADAAVAAAADAAEEAAHARAALEAHVTELLARTDECAQLKRVVAALTGEEEGEESGKRGGVPSLPSAPTGDTRAAAHAARMASAAADLDAERLAAQMLKEAQEEAADGSGSDVF